MSLQSVVACRSVKDFSDPVLDLIERTYTESYQKNPGMSASSPAGFLTVILMWSILQLIRRPVMEE